jgi:hypothetical protein
LRRARGSFQIHYIVGGAGEQREYLQRGSLGLRVAVATSTTTLSS